jgi:alpha,alpha-trehalase
MDNTPFEPPTDQATFAPLDRLDGYLPLERYGLIGDGATCALVGADGAIAWMCLPRFDSDAIFCSLLDRHRGGRFLVAPEDIRASRQWYEKDSGVLVTEMRSATGLVRVIDALLLRRGADFTEDVSAGRSELMRCIQVLDGDVRLVIDLEPRGGAETRALVGGLDIRWAHDPDLGLHLSADRPLDGLHTEVSLSAGDRMTLSLRWGEYAADRRRRLETAGSIQPTIDTWRRWCKHIDYEGPNPDLIRRSAITLKMLDHVESGALVAAATSSLPEEIGGVRNWDYRFAWVRDAAFCVHAFRRIGLADEMFGFLSWVLDSLERAGRAAVLYDIGGNVPGAEREDELLEGYRGSRPVRWGNGAATQTQNDAYGEIVDCAWQWAKASGEPFPPELWERICPLVEQAAKVWDTPDHGIWEIRSDGRLFTYSVAMCEVALHRGAELARAHHLPGDADAWDALAQRLVGEILEHAWDEDTNSLTESFGAGGAVDASLLALPLRHVVPADHPKMVATVEAVQRMLGAGDGLLYRYDPDVSDDGLPGHEGAFLLCSNWLVDNLTLQGRIDEATELFESICARAGTLGLLPEQIDPGSGLFLGNYPQAFSHVGLISNGVLLARAQGNGS